MNTRSAFAALAATVALAAASAAGPASAQPRMGEGKMMGKKPAMGGKRMAQSVYACKMCKTYYSAADAKKMKMMDPTGHKMTRMTMGSAKKMGYKMAKTVGAKTGHPKMGGDKMGGGGRM